MALFVVPSDYADLQRKGVASMVEDRDESGFFSKVISVHPFARSNRVLEFSETHSLHEFEAPNPTSGWFGGLRLRLHQLIHVFVVAWRVSRLVREHRVHLVRATDPYLSGLVGWLVSRCPRTPFCVSIHADYDVRFRLGDRGGTTVAGSRRVAKRLERFVLRRADMVLPIRDSLKEKALRVGVPPSRIRTIPHGIEMAAFDRPPKHDLWRALDLRPDVQIVSFVGRIARDNYVDDVLELARRLERENCVVVIAGGGPEEDRIRTTVNSDPMLRRVRMLGFQPQPLVLDLRRASAVNLCLMAGFSLLEACASGRPVISYDVEWHAELVRSGRTGVLVPEGDIDRLEEATLALLRDRELATQLGRAAAVLIRQRHSREAAQAARRKCYETLLGTSSCR